MLYQLPIAGWKPTPRKTLAIDAMSFVLARQVHCILSPRLARPRAYGHGEIQSMFTKKVTRKIDGSEVSWNGSEDDPACYVTVDDGNNVLKLASELKKHWSR